MSKTDVAPAAAGNLHLAYTPDGKNLISMGAGTITVWNAASNKKIREMDCGGGHGFALRPDGKALAAIHHEKVEIWNPETSQKLTTLEPLFSPTVLAYTPDGKQLAIAGGTVLEFWDVDQRKELQSFPSLELTVVSLAFRPDGKKLALGGQGKKLEHAVGILDLSSGETTLLFEERVGTNGGWISGLVYTPQGKTLLTFGGVDKLALRDAETGRILANLDAPERPWDAVKAQTTLVLSPKGVVLAACGNQVRLWRLESDRILNSPATTVKNVSRSWRAVHTSCIDKGRCNCDDVGGRNAVFSGYSQGGHWSLLSLDPRALKCR